MALTTNAACVPSIRRSGPESFMVQAGMESGAKTLAHVDLHLHTSYSDGRWSPEQVASEARARGLAAISITDHDVLDGVDEAEAAAAQAGIEFVPGIELTADWGGRTVHILGHGIDPRDRSLRASLDRGRRLMREHVDQVLTALETAGEPLAATDLAKYRARYAAGASLVLAMVERGILKRVRNGAALLRLASDEPRAYSAAEAIALIHGAGGVASLAHPAKIRRAAGGVREPRLLSADDLAPLMAAGLDGLEVWQIVHPQPVRDHYAALAQELGLLAVGGSDCHGPRRGAGPRIGSEAVPYGVFDRLSDVICARRSPDGVARA